jgi:hypothetical protein
MLVHARCLLAVVLLSGCLTGQGRVATSEPLAQLQAECEVIAVRGDGSAALRVAVEQGVLASLYLVLRGAATGAFWGVRTGGGAADGAWIGAAVGAGLGVAVGVVTGVQQSLEEQRQYRAAYETCVAVRLNALQSDP